MSKYCSSDCGSSQLSGVSPRPNVPQDFADVFIQLNGVGRNCIGVVVDLEQVKRVVGLAIPDSVVVNLDDDYLKLLLGEG